MRSPQPIAVCGLVLSTWLASLSFGGEGERRFPPLQVPEGFSATLFACDPLVEYPSVIAAGPRAGSLFVAADFMTGLGTEIVRRDEVRLIEDTDGDGHADKSTVFAGEFNSIQGLAYHDGALFVMHAPFLTVVRERRGAGQAVERRELLTGLGLPPEKDQIRLHNANGVVPGHDGWLYLALGDRGCDVARPEGDRLVLQGGGILRCRIDGRDLHVFATGLRNIYDVALDEALDVFVRDNENDGGDYKIRLCHSFHGADHGYPYLYYERPAETLPPLADLGLGSAAGGLCYLEPHFPPEYRGHLFFCEWGRAVVRYPRQPAQSTFAPVKESDFAFGAANDPYGFKPTDLVVDRDGALYVSDWADGQRPRRGRGRIYCIRHEAAAKRPPTSPLANTAPERLDQLVTRLDDPSYWQRTAAQEAIERRGPEGLQAVEEALAAKRLDTLGRLHAVWIVARLDEANAIDKLLALAERETDPRVQAQAVRALADRADPVFIRRRLDAGPGDADVAGRLAQFAAGRAAPVVLETIVALGRLRWPGTPDFLREHVTLPANSADRALLHAAQQSLRRVGNWPPVLAWLDEPPASGWRTLALHSLSGQFEPQVVDGVIGRLQRETDARCRRELAETLTRVRQRPGAWEYWGYRPPPRPAHSVVWERTEPIEQALGNYLADDARTDPDGTERLPVLKAMLREKIPVPTAILAPWLETARSSELVAALLAALHAGQEGNRRDLFEAVVRRRDHTAANRITAVAHLAERLGADESDRLLALARTLETGPVLAELLQVLGRRQSPAAAATLLLDSLASAHPAVRASAAGALAQFPLNDPPLIGRRNAGLRELLHDSQPAVREAAALAAGRLGIKDAADRLLELASDTESAVRRASLTALRLLREPRGVPRATTALADPATTLPALELLAELGGPEQIESVSDVARRQPSVETLAAIGVAIRAWSNRPGVSAKTRQALERGLAEIHGSSAVFLGWHVRGPLAKDADDAVSAAVAGRELPSGAADGWRWIASRELVSRVPLGAAKQPDDSWLAYGELTATNAASLEWMSQHGPGDDLAERSGRVSPRASGSHRPVPRPLRGEPDCRPQLGAGATDWGQGRGGVSTAAASQVGDGRSGAAGDGGAVAGGQSGTRPATVPQRGEVALHEVPSRAGQRPGPARRP